jgi:hypothetical protein
MRNPIPTLVLIAFTACTPGVGAQVETQRLVEISPPSLLEDEAALFEPRHIGFGMTAPQVTEAMHGKPDQKPAADLWVYWHFHTAADRTGKFNTLVVYFTEGRVTKFRLVERKALAALLGAVRQAKAGAIATK